MGDLPAEELERLLWPGAKVIRLMPHNYLEQLGLPKGVLPPASWATVRGSNASAKDVERVLALSGISSHVEVAESAREPPLGTAARVLHRIVRSVNKQRALVVNAAFERSGSSESSSVTAGFADTYEQGELLGRGHFSQVFQATHRRTRELFAVKCLRDDALTKEGREMLVAEVGALTRLSHPHVVAHHGFFAEGDSYYLVLDYCAGGGLERVLHARQRLPEVQAKQVIRQVLAALEYCHAMGHIHRDVKAENVLLTQPLDATTPASEIHVKLADFGFSEELGLASGRLRQICGTPQYLSPELVSGRGYGTPADIWAAGILSYMLLSGRVPFDSARNAQDLNKLIALGAVWYSPRDWDSVSSAAKDVAQRMLEVSPDARATASELLAHEWFQE
jgi:serine/threonine protein kinase